MIKLYYGLTIILITTFTGCAGMKNVGLIKSTDSYLYKSGTTNKTMISDYKDCSFKSSGVNQNNQIVNNIGASAARDMNNASSHKFFMDSCFDQKGYELYNERYMQTVKKWDADFYKNSQQGFFWRKMTDDEISAYATDGGTYHYLDADNKEVVITEEYIRKNSHFPWKLVTNKQGYVVDTSKWTPFSQPGR